jgi:hypothetical protein
MYVVGHDNEGGEYCKKGNGLHVLTVVDGSHPGYEGTDSGPFGRIDGYMKIFYRGRPLGTPYEAILAVDLALDLMGTLDAQRLAACAAEFLRIRFRMVGAFHRDSPLGTIMIAGT